MSSKKPNDSQTQMKKQDDLFQAWAVDLVLAVMKSADPETIGPFRWWSRAKTALYVGAASSETFREMISTMGRKLEIDCFTEKSASAIGEIKRSIGADFEPFRRMCERDALYIVAEAQAVRSLQKERKG